MTVVTVAATAPTAASASTKENRPASKTRRFQPASVKRAANGPARSAGCVPKFDEALPDPEQSANDGEKGLIRALALALTLALALALALTLAPTLALAI